MQTDEFNRKNLYLAGRIAGSATLMKVAKNDFSIEWCAELTEMTNVRALTSAFSCRSSCHTNSQKGTK